MLVVLIILSVGLLGVIIYFAISPKSSRILKLAALIALGLIGLSLGICGIILIAGFGEKGSDLPFPVLPDMAQPVKRGNSLIDILFLLALVAIFVLIIAIAVRDKKKLQTKEEKKPNPSLAFQHEDLKEKPDEDPLLTDDESFNIDIK